MKITIEINDGNLRSYSDKFLAAAWHAAQANPAPHGDRAAVELVQKLGWEIVRRWLGGVEPELYHHQPQVHYWDQLTRVARYTPGEGYHGGFTPEQRALWNAGTWSVKPEAAAALQPGLEKVVAAATAWHREKQPDGDFMRKHRAEQELLTALDALRTPVVSPAAADAPPAEHKQVAGWTGVAGECGAECACGTTFDNFDTLEEAVALLERHIRDAVQPGAAEGAGSSAPAEQDDVPDVALQVGETVTPAGQAAAPHPGGILKPAAANPASPARLAAGGPIKRAGRGASADRVVVDEVST